MLTCCGPCSVKTLVQLSSLTLLVFYLHSDNYIKGEWRGGGGVGNVGRDIHNGVNYFLMGIVYVSSLIIIFED